MQKVHRTKEFTKWNNVAYQGRNDPGFSVGGGADPPGAPTYDFVKFSWKQHEIEKILGRRHAELLVFSFNPCRI